MKTLKRWHGLASNAASRSGATGAEPGLRRPSQWLEGCPRNTRANGWQMPHMCITCPRITWQSA